MSIESFFQETQQTLAFSLAGCQGRIAVYYGSNDDALKAGFDIIPGIDFPTDLCQGYPVLHAQIESYAGSGYRAFCGWIQIITRECLPAPDPRQSDVQRSWSIDVAPAMRESEIPFAVFGSLPSFFDAPCRNLRETTELTWIADTFLTTMPIRSRHEEISLLAGFRWGYREFAAREKKPVTLLPLEVTNIQVWNNHLSFLRKEFSSWRFKEGQ